MSIKQFPGGIITKNPTAPTTSSAKGIWTLDQAQNYTKQGIWPRSPGAPTIGTVTISGVTASVPFTAPADTGSTAITTYVATSSPGGITASSATSPISVPGLVGGTSYTFTVTATNSAGTGAASAASNSVTAVVQGQVSYTTPGTYSWVAPAGVTSVSVVTVGGGGGGAGNRLFTMNGGGGGGLAYTNNITVIPGNSYSLRVGSGYSFYCSAASTSKASHFNCNPKASGGGCTTFGYGTTAGAVVAGSGGSGGAGGAGAYNGNAYGIGGGAGGAGGYSGAGGRGSTCAGTCCDSNA